MEPVRKVLMCFSIAVLSNWAGSVSGLPWIAGWMGATIYAAIREYKETSR